jgi:hypothetical protein
LSSGTDGADPNKGVTVHDHNDIDSAPNQPANKAVVRQFFAALSAGDYPAAAALVDPEGAWWSLTSRTSRPLAATVERIEGRARDTVDGFTFAVGTLTAEDNRVSAVVDGHAAYPDGRVYENAYHYLFRVVDGRIVQGWEYHDTALADRVLRGGVPGETDITRT